MPLSKEQLLAPRYKVIADFPGSQYSLNHIIELHYNINSVVEGQIKFYDHYPHLFQKLEWWQERSFEDLPEYVCFSRSTDRRISKVEKWDMNKYVWCKTEDFDYSIFPANSYLLPATLEEYTQYINSKQ